MTTWRTVEDSLAELLGDMSVLWEGASSHVERVYTEPPQTIQDVPCVIIMPERHAVFRHAGLRRRVYTVPVRVFVRDAMTEDAIAVAKLYREAMTDLLDSNLKLGQADVSIGNQEMQEITPIEWAPVAGSGTSSQYFMGFEANIDIVIEDSPTFSAGM